MIANPIKETIKVQAPLETRVLTAEQMLLARVIINI